MAALYDFTAIKSRASVSAELAIQVSGLASGESGTRAMAAPPSSSRSGATPTVGAEL